MAGAGVARDDAWDEIITLAERHQAPVWASPMSARNSFPENHRLFAGFLAAERASIVASLSGHDFILVLGTSAFTYHIAGTAGAHVPEGATLVQITDEPGAAAWAPTGTAIVSNVRLGIQALLRGPAPIARSTPPTRAAVPALPPTRLTDSYLLQQIAALRPPGSILVEEAPSSRGPMHDHLPIIERDGFYTCASGGLGYALPAAVGVALGRPGEKVIAFLGDGSSMYSIQGLWSAAQLKLPITFVIVRNGRYQAMHEFRRQFDLADLQGIELPAIDFCGLARSQGVAAECVKSCDELDAALRAAFAASLPNLVEVQVESDDN